MSKRITGVVVLGACLAVLTGVMAVQADEFTDEDVQRWQEEYMSVVEAGRVLWGGTDLSTNGVACGQCHPNGANTHPETYPKFQQQLGRVAALRDMINWCIQNPLEGETLDPTDPRMVAMEAYVSWERRGVAMAPGKH